jgi:two-component system sensor histidine kinase NreB
MVVEHTHYDIQGNARSVEVHAYPVFDSRGAVIQVIESVVDITEQKRLQENLRLYSQLTAGVLESERARISHELYEDIIQTLSAHSRQLDNLATTSGDVLARNPSLLEAMVRQTQDIIQDLRLMGSGLRPPVLDHLGLVPAIRSLATDLKGRSEVEAAVEVIGTERRMARESELVLYRVVEEALRNTSRHSDATKALISVEYQENKTRIAVVDNGKGFSRPEILTDLVRDGRLGLASMEERVSSAGGLLLIESQSGIGTSITVELPG